MAWVEAASREGIREAESSPQSHSRLGLIFSIEFPIISNIPRTSNRPRILGLHSFLVSRSAGPGRIKMVRRPNAPKGELHALHRASKAQGTRDCFCKAFATLVPQLHLDVSIRSATIEGEDGE